MLPEGGPEFANNAVQARAGQYGTLRMGQMQKLLAMMQAQQGQGAPMGDPNVMAQFGSAMQGAQGLDPAAAWRQVSGSFARMAGQQAPGMDPRMWLHQMMRGPRQPMQSPY